MPCNVRNLLFLLPYFAVIGYNIIAAPYYSAGVMLILYYDIINVRRRQ